MTAKDVISTVFESIDDKILEIDNKVKKLKRFKSEVSGKEDQSDTSIYRDVEKPVIEVMIFSLSRNLKNSVDQTTLVKKLYIKNDKATLFASNRSVETIDTKSIDMAEITILGFQVEHTSVYGKKMEMAISEFKDNVWRIIDTGDIIIVRTYLDKDKDLLTYSMEELLDGTSKDDIDSVYEYDFAGIITHKQKNVSSTEQFRIEAVDMVKIMQQINVSLRYDGNLIWKYSEILNLFFRAILNRYEKQGNRFFAFDEVGEFRKTNVVQVDVDEIDDLLNLSSNKEWDRHVYIAQMFGNPVLHESSGDGTFRESYYAIYATPVAIANIIMQFIFDEMGLSQFFEVEIDGRDIMNELRKDAIFLNKKYLVDKSYTPFTLLVAYFYDTSEEGNFNWFDTRSEFTKSDILDYLCFFSVNKFLSFAKLSDEEVFLKENLYAAHPETSVELWDKKLALFTTNNAFDLSADLSTYSKIFGSEVLYTFNNYFEVMANNRIVIRSSEFRGSGIESIEDSIPLSMFIYYSYSLFNFTPVYNDVFRGVLKRSNITNFSSYGYMHSLAQATWFTSGFQFFEDRFRFVFVPLVTPLLYHQVKKYSDYFKETSGTVYPLNKTLVYTTDELLEFSFDQLNMNRKILYLNTEDDDKEDDEENVESDQESREVEFITLYEGNPIYIINKSSKEAVLEEYALNVDPLMYNAIDVKSDATRSVLKPFTVETFSFYNLKENYTLKQLPHVFNQYKSHSTDGGFYMTSGTSTTIPANSDLLVGASRHFEKGVRNPEEDYDTLTPHVFPPDIRFLGKEPYSDDFRLSDIELLIIDSPIRFNFVSEVDEYSCVFKHIPISYKVEASRASDHTIKLPFKLRLTGKMGKYSEEKRADIDVILSGIKSVIDMKKLRASVEFLLFKDFLPPSVRDNIFIKMRKVDTSPSSDLQTYEEGGAKVMNLTEVHKYLLDIIKVIEKKYSKFGKRYIPHEIYASLDIQQMYSFFAKEFKFARENIGTFPEGSTEPYTMNFEGETLSGMDTIYVLRRRLGFMVLEAMRQTKEIDIFGTQEELKFNLNGYDIIHSEVIEWEDEADVDMSIDVIGNGIRAIIKVLSVIETFTQNILRANYDNGSLYVANRGYHKLDVGSYIYLVDTRKNFHISGLRRLQKNATQDIILSAKRVANFLRAEDEQVDLDISFFEKFFSNTRNSVYAASYVNFRETHMKPFGWFVWKTITYLGDASGGGDGTSGYTQKIYLSRDGVSFIGQFEEEDFITKLANSLGEEGKRVFSFDGGIVTGRKESMDDYEDEEDEKEPWSVLSDIYHTMLN